MISELVDTNSNSIQDLTKVCNSYVTNTSSMFSNSEINQNISSWDVSKVTNMNRMFENNSTFNQDLSTWDVSNVTDMSGMFLMASSFNQDISSWDVSNVTDTSDTFNQALLIQPRFVFMGCK